MESIYTELALYGNKKECASADNVYIPISEVCYGMVSLYRVCGLTITFELFFARLKELNFTSKQAFTGHFEVVRNLKS